MEKEAFKKILKEKVSKLNIVLSDEQLEKFYLYKEMIKSWNQKVNLTTIVEDKEIIDKHFIDSLSISHLIKENISIIDIGTGAGFPGIPLQILNQNHSIVLFDSLQKRLTILDEMIKQLNLNNIHTLHGRAEETFQKDAYREKFDIATSRAVAELNVLVEYMLPAVKVNGYCICMKGNHELEKEIQKAKKAIFVLGGKIEKIEKVILPETNIERNIIIIKKVKNTPNRYPRKPGTPKKEPIS